MRRSFRANKTRVTAITENQLQGQIITLQGTVIGLLDEALRTGRLDNINKLYNATELARDGSLAALQGQYQRMLQAAPIQRPMTIRRISSQPSVQSGARRPLPPPSQTLSKSKTVAVTPPASNGEEPLFCPYSIDLQRDVRIPVQNVSNCSDCGSLFDLEQGHAWKVFKEVVRERISTADYDEEIMEDRSYLITNRFFAKSHSPNGEYACVLCARYRPGDYVCRNTRQLVKHIQERHTAEEFADPDIKEIG